MELGARIAGAIALLALAVPAVRVVADVRLRRMFARVALVVAIAAIGWVLFVGAAAYWLPGGLPWMGGAAALVGAGLLWHARPGYGRKQGLPPGSLSLARSVRGLADRDFYRGQYRRFGPVFKTAQFSANAVCILGLDRARRLFHDHGDAIGPSPLPFTEHVMGGFLRYMDVATHDIYGGLFRKAISSRVADSALPVVREIVRRELDAVPSDAGSGVAAGIAPGPLLQRIAYESLLLALFGLNAGTSGCLRFETLYRRLAGFSITHAPKRPARRDLAKLRAWVLRESPGRERGPCVLSELTVHNPAMPDAVCVDNLIFMLRIATSNLSGLLAWLVVMLGQHPEWRAKLRAAAIDEQPTETPNAVDAFIWETLRLSQSEFLYRRAERDIEFEGYRIPKGWLIRVCVAESHRDPAVFADPDRFTDRFVGCPSSMSTLSPFGIDRHACIGVGLTMMVSRTLLLELANRPALRLTAAAPPVRDFRHWKHWRPNPGLRVAFHAPAENAVSP